MANANDEKTGLPKAPAKSSSKPSSKKSLRLRTGKFFREMKSELKKVIWPTKKQTAYNTGIAVAVMVVAGIVVWGFDSLASGAVQALIAITG